VLFTNNNNQELRNINKKLTDEIQEMIKDSIEKINPLK
jgi:hypothetical protein